VRVLFWTHTFWPQIGGVEVFSAELLPELKKRGHELVVVTSQISPRQAVEDQYKGILIYRFPFRAAMSSKNIQQLIEIRQRVATLKRTFAPDLVHVNYGADVDSFFHLTTATTHAAPLLITLHYIAEPPNSLAEPTMRAAQWVVGCSAAILDNGRQLVPEITPRSSVIHNSLATPTLLPCPLPTKRPRLLCLGRLSLQKGFDIALAAFASVVKRFPDARLIIAGDGPERPNLERRTVELGLTNVVDLIGWVAPERVAALLNTVTAVVMPSRQEPFGLVALEAALMARPIVATRVGGLPEVVVHEQTGLLVESENSSALAEAIGYLLMHPGAATQMGQAARLRAHHAFTWERHVNAYDSLYQRLVADWREEHAPTP